jgi:hypothetical protein
MWTGDHGPGFWSMIFPFCLVSVYHRRDMGTPCLISSVAAASLRGTAFMFQVVI